MMMALSWNEIKTRAIAFSKEWENETSEDAEAKSFWDDFFNVFGVGRRRVATFEQQIKKTDKKTGFIDLLWKGVILIEHKSRGRDLDKAFQQAKDYFPGLKEKELPRYILVSDFERFRLYDLEENTQHEFKLPDFVNHVQLFWFIAGYQKRTYKEQDPVNIEAAEKMGKLHDKLKAIGYEGHQLELYLVRLVFCLFADDTGIFEKDIFRDYLELKTNEDGSDVAAHLSQIFQVLNTQEDKRLKNLDEALAVFPYVNGKLFEEQIPMAHFDSDMRRMLLDACLLDWGKLSPAIFGSLFQSVMDAKKRRNLGAHYTSEKNILKLIKPLFLDELWFEFEKIKNDKDKLKKLHDKISKLRFLDPACGCGNFLIIAYRELRLLELKIVKKLLEGQQVISIENYFLVDVDKFYGIECEEFPGLIAWVAMWLMDHQMNVKASLSFGDYFKRIPLIRSAGIKYGNALTTDWQSLLQPSLSDLWSNDEVNNLRYNYILGNPPFIGSRIMNESQKNEMRELFKGVKGVGELDYVAAWYLLGANYLKKYQPENPNQKPTLAGFVSTNSISQGLQVAILWNELICRYEIDIFFAHQTFKWGNEAKGNANVHVVIVGFSNFKKTKKFLYEYADITAQPTERIVDNINPYLVNAKNVIIGSRKNTLNVVPQMNFGNMPADGGEYLFTENEKNEFVDKEPGSANLFKEIISAHEFLNGKKRFCLWLKNIKPNEIKNLPLVLKRIENVRQIRLKSSRPFLAEIPALFEQITQPDGVDYILIPRHSSEGRKYIPMAFFDKSVIASDSCMIIPNATLYHFGMIHSIMHMAWLKTTCGRIKSDYRYSKDVVYNNFPWPENPMQKQKDMVEKAAQSVLGARAAFPDSTLADLYNPNTMPPVLVKAHQTLDKAVDLCYRSQPFINETKRIEFLFELYDKYTAGLFVKERKRK